MAGFGWRRWPAGGATLALCALIAGVVSAAMSPGAPPPGSPAPLPGLTDVIAMGADPTGKQDSAPAFQRALGDKAISKLIIPCGQYRLGSMVTVPYGKMVEGFGDCAQVNPDAGITAFKLTGSTGGGSITTLRDFRIWQVQQHADNVGILIDNAATGMEAWVLERVSVLGSALAGEGKASGTGIRSNFGLTGTIRDCVVQYWDTGIDFQPVRVPHGYLYPNANLITGSKIRVNRIGVRLVVQSAFLVGNTIEANRFGVVSETDSGLLVTLVANHFENLGAEGADLEHRIGRLASVGNLYAGIVERPSVIVPESAALSSFGDILTAGSIDPGPPWFRAFGGW